MNTFEQFKTKATFTRTYDYVTRAIKNRERFFVACVALFTRTCVNFGNFH